MTFIPENDSPEKKEKLYNNEAGNQLERLENNPLKNYFKRDQETNEKKNKSIIEVPGWIIKQKKNKVKNGNSSFASRREVINPRVKSSEAILPSGGLRNNYARDQGVPNSRQAGGPERFVSITYEEIGLFPRSFNRVFDRFLKQIFADVENLVLQEYRFYRYLFLTTIKTIFILFFVPLFVNFFAKTYIVRPVTEYFWNTKQPEIFLNSYQQKRAFSELQEFEEQLFFESLISPVADGVILPPASMAGPNNKTNLSSMPSLRDANLAYKKSELSVAHSKPLNQKAVPEVLENSEILNRRLILRENPVLQVFPIENKNPSLDRLGDISPFIWETNALTEVPQTSSQNPSGRSQINRSRSIPEELPLEAPGSEGLEASGPRQNLIYKKNEVYNNKVGFVENTLQQKTLELAIRYNNYSIEAITNFFADLLSFMTLLYLLISLEIQINITKSFLLEVFFGLDDSKKSLLILLVTDLLVGYHSPNIWELFFEFIFNHYGIPESQTVIFLLVATLPVLLDVLFKYLIFRHLNRSSPTTVATYHAMIE
uniref:Potassium/proton antiporter CemA n=1 Tax=Lobochlamys culleus TaxID=51693 RepID=A0A0S2IDQ4_9CHLO|nr:chloroplast enveloppe membrane protein [Lobochlamys culleus]